MRKIKPVFYRDILNIISVYKSPRNLLPMLFKFCLLVFSVFATNNLQGFRAFMNLDDFGMGIEHPLEVQNEARKLNSLGSFRLSMPSVNAQQNENLLVATSETVIPSNNSGQCLTCEGAALRASCEM